MSSRGPLRQKRRSELLIGRCYQLASEMEEGHGGRRKSQTEEEVSGRGPDSPLQPPERKHSHAD